VNHKQIDRMVASVPPTVEARQRRRVDGYAATARRCEDRIAGLRGDLEQALRAVSDDVDVETAADHALELLRELDALERVQPRIDAWLRVSVGALAEVPDTGPVGEGPI
jgi:hypothetical protein